MDGFSTLTVMTSDDVEAIRVDGELITSYYRTPMLSFTGRGIELIYGRVFTFRTVADHVGTYNYDVVAYDADGLASDVYKTTLTVVRQ